MVKNKSIKLIAIALIAIITFSLFAVAVAEHLHRSGIELPAPNGLSGSLDIKLKDDNGTVKEGDKSTTGTAIGTADQLKAFLKGNDPKGYLTGNIPDFNWGTHGTDVQFDVNRELDGNGFEVVVTAPRSSDANQMINEFVVLDWRNVLTEKDGGSYSHQIGATSPFLAINQGKLVNINFKADFVPNTSNGGGVFSYEWVRTKNRSNDSDNRNANFVALSYGIVAGINFGEMTNCKVDYIAGSNMRIQNLAGDMSARYGKENGNHIEVGLFAGCNAGSISNVTGIYNGQITVLSRSSNTWGIQTTGKASARAMFGIIAGRMQTDKNVPVNKAKISTATIYNSVVSGSGAIDIQAIHCGAKASGKGQSYGHAGVVAGGNSPYSGTIVNRDTQQSYGIIDGIISAYNGEIQSYWHTDWHSQGSTSGEAKGNRAMVDCGKISNVTFLDRYDGHIDNCGCVGAEHIATRANGFSNSVGDANVTVEFDKASSSLAALIINVTPKLVNGKIPSDKIVFAINKRERQVNEHSNVVNKAVVSMFDYDNANFYNYNTDADGNVTNKTDVEASGKRALVRISEERAADDNNSFIFDPEIGTLAKARYETAADGKFSSNDRLEGAIDTFAYDGAEKGLANIVAWGDAEGVDTLVENTKYRKFVSQYRQENDSAYKPYDMGLLYPGVYKDIYIQASLSMHQAYVDPENRLVAQIQKTAAGVIITTKLKISPAKIVATSTDGNINYGAQDLTKDIEANDVSPIKLVQDTLAGYKFNFSIYTRDDQNSPRNELKSKVVDGLAVLPFDRIEYSQDGYIYQTAVTFDSVSGGYYVNETTSFEGRVYLFRAVKDLKNNEGKTIATTSVTVDSAAYQVKIDGTAPVVTASVGNESGVNYATWADRMRWKPSAFDLVFKISDLTVSDLKLKVKNVNAADNTATDVAITNTGAGYVNVKYTFGDNNAKVFFAMDKYGNRSVDYAVTPKVDTITPDFNLTAMLENVAHGGVLQLDGNAVADGSIANAMVGKLVSDRNAYVTANNLTSSAPSVNEYIYSFNINNTGFKAMDGNKMLYDRVHNPEYFKTSGGNRAVYDSVVVRVTSAAGLFKDIVINTQVNKGLLMVDEETIKVPDGGWGLEGIREETLLKRYTGDNLLGDYLLKALKEYFDMVITQLEGVARPEADRVVVYGEYAQSDVGNDILIVIDVKDPLGKYTIDATSVQYYGTIVPNPVSVRVHNATRQYGESEPIFKYEVNGTFGNDKVDLDKLIYPASIVNSSSPANQTYPVVVPAYGTAIGNYVIGTVTNSSGGSEIRLEITPKVLDEIDYDDSFAAFAYNGAAHDIVARFQRPDGEWSKLDVTYFTIDAGVEAPLTGKPVQVGAYKGKFSISDPNYILEDRRSIALFEVHKAKVTIDLPESQLMLKFNGQDRTINPILSNGAVPNITYYDAQDNVIYQGTDWGYLPHDAGKYKVKVEYLNVYDPVEGNVGNYFDAVHTYNMVIDKVNYSSMGTELNAIDKIFDNKTSEVILYNVPFGTEVPSDILLKPGPVEGSYIILSAKDAGIHIKKFTLKNRNIYDEEMTASIKISKANFVDYGVQLTGNEVTYDGKPHSIELINMPVGLDINITKVTGTSIGVEVIDNKITLTEAGKYTAILKLTNKNFNEHTFTAGLNIKQAKMNTAWADPVKAEYDGKAHGVTVYGVPSDLNMKSKTVVTVHFAGSKAIVVEPSDAEHTNYAIYGKIDSGIHNYLISVKNSNFEPRVINGAINIGVTTYAKYGTTVQSKEIDYDGNMHRMSIENLPLGTQVFDMDGIKVDSYIERAQAGEYNFNVRMSNPNVQDTGNVIGGTLTINKAACDKNYSINGLTADYSETVKSITFDKAQLREGADFRVEPISGMSVNDNVLTFKNAGTYDVKITVSHPNYVDKIVTAKVVINKVTAPYAGGVTITDRTVTYNGKSQKLEVGGLGGYSGYNLSTKYNETIIGDPINAGEYNANISITHPNYIDITGTAKLIINKAVMTELDGTMVLSEKVAYSGVEHGVRIVDGRGRILGKEYTVNVTYNDLPSGVLPIEAGVYVVKGFISRANYEDFAIVNDGELEITKLQSDQLKVDDINRQYNGKAVKFNVTKSDGSAMTAYTVRIRVGGATVEEIINAGTYDCELTISQTNYADVKLTCKVVITPVVVEVTYTNIENLVAGKENTLTGTYTDVNKKTHEVIFSFAEGYDPNKAGTYKATAVPEDSVNYVVSEKTAVIEFELKNGNVGAIAGGTAGGVAAVGIGVALFFVLKKKKIKL